MSHLLLGYYVHQLSPYIVRFNDRIGLHWYGFAYVMAFVCGYYVSLWLARKGYGPLAAEKVADFITYAAIFGVMLGGRLGWILFYGFGEVLENPLKALKLWEGGMSSHGGILGLVIFTFVYARMHRISWPALGDNLVVVAPIGLFFGRCANFINGELWGRPTTVPWAMQFPREMELKSPGLVAQAYAHDPVALEALGRLLPPRHPSQIYEALLEGVFLFACLWIVRTRMKPPVGMLTGLFFLIYAAVRIFGEEFREPDVGIAFTLGLTRGQFLSLFMIAIGAAFVVYSLCTRRRTPAPGETVSAVLLAGGRSTRMGRDKALLPLAYGRVLWQRQLNLLASLDPVEVMISGWRRPEFPDTLTVIEDAADNQGPLAGLVRAMETMRSPRLAALAIDLPEMTSEFLRRLLSEPAAGIVPRVNGRLEPLAAVYPTETLPLARERLAGDDRSLRGFVLAAEAAGLVRCVDTLPAEAALFVNWNSPGDYQP